MLLRFAILSLLLLVGCTSSNNKIPKGNVLRVNLAVDPPTLDSRKASHTTSINVLLNLFEGLTRIGQDDKPAPAIAKEIIVSKDKRTYTFKLRHATWSNGEPLTSYDFLKTLQSALDPKFPSPYAYKLFIIENAQEVKTGLLPIDALGIQAPDSQTLIVKLINPTPYFLELTSFPLFFPVYQKESPDLVSNGPFRLKKWDHESEMQLEKNPNYWDAETVKLDGVHLTMVEDTITEYYMYEMGELDWCGSPLSNLPSEIVPALKQEHKLQCYPIAAVYYYKINTALFPFSNQNLRRALGLAINRDAIVKHILQAEQIPATSIVPKMPGWEKASHLFQDGDTEGAQLHFAKALEELGLKREELPTITLTYNNNREHQKVAQAIQHQWKEILGVNTQLETYDWKVYLAKINNRDYQIGRMGWVGDFNDAVSFLGLFKTREDPNSTGWENPRFKALLDEAARTLDTEKRKKILKEAEEVIVSEMPVIPLFYIIFCYLKKPYVHNVFLSSLGNIDFKWATLDK